MLFDLEDLLEKPANRGLDAAEFEEAADRLLFQQCLFRDDWNARRTYELVVRFKGYFTDLLQAIGRDLVINERELMIELRPRDSVARMQLALDETILLLSLRAAFEQGVIEFSQGDYGEVEISSMELLERYEPLTGKPRPSWPRVREILKAFKRRRFIDLGDEYPDDVGVAITIRPAIRGVTGEAWLTRIEEFLAVRGADQESAQAEARHGEGPASADQEVSS